MAPKMVISLSIQILGVSSFELKACLFHLRWKLIFSFLASVTQFPSKAGTIERLYPKVAC
jgi:hypothetical protein